MWADVPQVVFDWSGTGREDDYPPGILTVEIDSPGMLGFH